MTQMNRRRFLVRTGLALGASMLSGVTSSTGFAGRPADEALTNWEWVRSQFRLSPDLIHMAGFFLASHPASVRKAIERHRDGLDANQVRVLTLSLNNEPGVYDFSLAVFYEG